MAHSNCDNRQEFENGAFRDSDKGKINYIACFSPLVLEAIGSYLRNCATLPDGSIRPCDNWKKGITLKSYMESKFRHLMATWKAYEGYSDPEEEFDIVKALCAELFNTMGPLHEILQERLAEKRPKRPTMVLKRDKVDVMECGDLNNAAPNTNLVAEMADMMSTGCTKEPKIEVPSGKWEEIYACFVIRDDSLLGRYFLGDGAWVARREHAVRFTKQLALDYIENNKGNFMIEDAT